MRADRRLVDRVARGVAGGARGIGEKILVLPLLAVFAVRMGRQKEAAKIGRAKMFAETFRANIFAGRGWTLLVQVKTSPDLGGRPENFSGQIFKGDGDLLDRLGAISSPLLLFSTTYVRTGPRPQGGGRGGRDWRRASPANSRARATPRGSETG